jgi:hypothetical protein
MIKADRDKMIAVLESEHEGPGPEAAAEALYQAALEIESTREHWGVLVLFDTGQTASYGPFLTKVAAKQAAKFYGLGEESVRLLRPADELRFKDLPPDGSRTCPQCQHPKFAGWPQAGKCIVPGCDCTLTFKNF